MQRNDWFLVCQDAGDESGDIVIELPEALMQKLGWSVGDDLTVERTGEAISIERKKPQSP